MSLFNDYALLFAVALPVATIAALQVSLLLAGERGTGLLPAIGGYPSIGSSRAVEAAARGTVVRTEAAVATEVEASNDEAERIAA